MRWPFTNLFRGAAARDDGSSAGIETAPPGADEPTGPGPAAESRPAAWRALPPVQRAVGAAPVTAPSTAFARGLAGRRAPDPMVAPLAHDMLADGPAGMVSGLAVPLVPRASSVSDPRSAADLPAPAADRMRPRARGTVSTAAASPGLAGREDAAADVADQGAAAVPGDMAMPGGPESGLPTIAQRVLPVARMAASGPAAPAPAIAATRVGEATAPAPIVARAVPIMPATAGSAIAPGPSELPAATTAPDGSVLASGPAGARAVDTAQVLADGADRGPIIGRRTLGESRRLGLGAPLAGIPPTTVRTKGRADLPVARLASPSSAPPDPAFVAPAVPPPVAAAATQAPLPRLAVARRPSAGSGSGSAAGPAGPGRAAELSLASPAAVAVDTGSAGSADDTTEATRSDPAQGELADGGSSGPARPLVGGQPIAVSGPAPGEEHANADADAGTFEALPLQRATVPRPPSDVSAVGRGADREDASAEVGPAEVGPLRRGQASDAPASPSQRVGAQTALRGAPATAPLVAGRSARAGVSLPVSTMARATPADPASITSRLASPGWPAFGGGHEQVPAAAWDVARPAPYSAPAAALERDEHMTVARATTLASRGSASATAATLPLVRPSEAAAAFTPAASPAAGLGDAIGWSAATGFTSVAPQPGPIIQRAVEIDELTVTPAGDGAGGAAPASAGSAAGQPGSAATGGEGTDYEELAEQVYEKIRARLMTELLLDRERAGILVDW